MVGRRHLQQHHNGNPVALRSSIRNFEPDLLSLVVSSSCLFFFFFSKIHLWLSMVDSPISSVSDTWQVGSTVGNSGRQGAAGWSGPRLGWVNSGCDRQTRLVVVGLDRGPRAVVSTATPKREDGLKAG